MSGVVIFQGFLIAELRIGLERCWDGGDKGEQQHTAMCVTAYDRPRLRASLGAMVSDLFSWMNDDTI